MNYVHRWFEAQAEANPEAIAVACDDVEISYGELNRRANQVAHELVRFGVRPDSLVGICLDRSPRMVVALLAVLKAGGAYVPLDPAYPAPRLQFMLRDAGVSIALTEANCASKLDGYEGARI
jgi:non-ribosomal peptide synthetase component F